MTSLHVTLPDPMIEFIDGLVAPDRFTSRDAVLEAAIADRQDRIDALNAEIQVGLDELDRGEGIVVTDLKAWIETLGNEPA